MSLGYKVIFGRTFLSMKKKVTGIVWNSSGGSKILERCLTRRMDLFLLRECTKREDERGRENECILVTTNFANIPTIPSPRVAINTSIIFTSRCMHENQSEYLGSRRKAGCASEANVKALKRYRRRKLISCGTRAGVGLCRAKNKNTVSTFYPGASMRLRTTNL